MAWNYLRMRGEYLCTPGPSRLRGELPPHARRIHPAPTYRRWVGGTTSACAENTGVAASLIPNPRNYLRMRGEYILKSHAALAERELPPHARRIPESCHQRNA